MTNVKMLSYTEPVMCFGTSISSEFEGIGKLEGDELLLSQLGGCIYNLMASTVLCRDKVFYRTPQPPEGSKASKFKRRRGGREVM